MNRSGERRRALPFIRRQGVERLIELPPGMSLQPTTRMFSGSLWQPWQPSAWSASRFTSCQCSSSYTGSK